MINFRGLNSEFEGQNQCGTSKTTACADGIVDAVHLKNTSQAEVVSLVAIEA